MKRAILQVVLALLPLIAADAQRRVAIEIDLPAASLLSRDAPTVAVSDLLAGESEEALIRDGFPARLSFVAELWPKGGLFKRAAAEPAAWNVIIDYEPLEKVFRVVRRAEDGTHPLGVFTDFGKVRALLAQPYKPLIRAPQRRGDYFYTVSLEVERMTANDLAEMRRWADGELRPAMRGERSAGSTIVSGLGTIVKHLLGAQKKKYRGQSPTFSVRQ